MADRKRGNIKVINRSLTTIKSLMGNIYKTTYSSTPELSDSVETISQDIEDNISSIVTRNNMDNISNISKLYTRLKIKQIDGNGDLVESVRNVFEDPTAMNGILSMYLENRWIKDLEMEYDTILRYMPRLREALKAKKENVLSSDSFSKDFINATPTTTTDKSDIALFTSRNEDLNDMYDLQRFYDKAYDEAAKYGETFVYLVPYSRAIKTLLKNKHNTRPGSMYGNNLRGLNEVTIIENGNVSSSFMDIKESNSMFMDNKGLKYSLDQLSLPSNLKVIFDDRGFLESAFNEAANAEEFSKNAPKSVLEQYGTIHEAVDTKTIPDDLEIPKDFDKTSTDGLVTSIKDDGNVKSPGSVLKMLERARLLPLYVDRLCLGYYYIEFTNGANYDLLLNNDHLLGRDMIGFTGVQPQGRNFSDASIEDMRNQFLAKIAWGIADRIDSKFVNQNQDIAKDIYEILKYNDVANMQTANCIRVTFIPPDDIEHIYFELDEKTHRGISDLTYALIPAKLYSCLYITNTLGHLTRGHDKRVYYVKQNVETNIAQTMLNVINQIKRGNFGLREIENMNSILNITGRFNDYVIPVGPSGDSPIQFEVMPGQEFQSDNDLMDRLEEMAINATDMPIEYIQNRMNSIDYAVQATTVNLKVLRQTYARQSIMAKYMSSIQTKLYNNQYNENYKIECMLPTPIVANITNMNDMLGNTRNYVDAIASYEYDGSSDPNADAKKAIFTKLMMRKRLASYVKMDEVDELMKQTDIEYDKVKEDQNSES